ncbi:MAG: nucleotide exchange factor GrpE [Bacillota bacterium]|nr:nucleotide exchange factor GrpE [Bacillota bacterium]
MTTETTEMNVQETENSSVEETETAAEPQTMEECLTAENESLIAELEELKQQLEKAEKEKDELTETLQRHQAEFDNFRRRTLKEKDELRLTAASGLLTDLLPVLDNFGRALMHGKDDPVLQGVTMVQKQMLEILVNNGLVIIGAEGEEFDPKVHDAIMQEEKEGAAANTVIEVLQPGYMFHDKLLRPAMVKVAK